MNMKKLPIIVILLGCLFSILYANTHAVTKTINGVRYELTNYNLMALGMAISLGIGIFILWIIKRKE